ncbi:HEAT repeat-containing protein 6 [Mortierella alpina]|uniref:HEAT repeat-containing protein 6 n=1 Tax=Mortierella alpina TaxID=64518 RepID=A0A9P6J273_MORAP|nr:HEAT repeat-containing protein 6 [Mortierella alpina]
MAQPARQRHYRHHRPAAAPRRGGNNPEHPSQPPPTPTHSQTPRASPYATDTLSPADRDQLRDQLNALLERAKAAGNQDMSRRTAEESEEALEFSKTALEKVTLACKSMSATVIHDVELLSTVVYTLFNQELIKVQGLVPPQRESIDALCAFFLAAFKGCHPQKDLGSESAQSSAIDAVERRQVDILRALGTILFENGSYVKETLSELCGVITTVGEVPVRNEKSELRRMALNCLANLVHKTGSLLSPFHEHMYRVILSNLTATSYYESGSTTVVHGSARRKERAAERKLISSALRALHFLIQEDKHISTRSIPPLMDVISRFMFFTSESGTHQPVIAPSSSAFNVGIINRATYPTQTSIIPSTKSAGSAALDAHAEPSLAHHWNLQSSDSEYSDSESGAHLAQRRQHDGKVRLNALLCLQTLARGAPKQLQPHWPKFLTSSTSAPMLAGSYKTPSLLVLIGSDPISTVRSAACVVLGYILENSKQYLAMAEEKAAPPLTKSHTGILALSERVGLMTRELHAGLASAMEAADNSVDQNVVIQMIKCCSSVVANCSYERMRSGLPLLLFNAVKRFMDSAEPALQASALMFLTTTLSNASARTEVQETILVCTEPSESRPPDVLIRLLSLVENHQVAAIIRVEAWNALRAIAGNHFTMIRTSWPRLDAAMMMNQTSEDHRISSAGLVFLEEYAKSGVSAMDPLASEWWNDVLERHVLKAFAEDNPAIKALGCDCLSVLTSDTFDALPNRLGMLILSLVLGTALDDNTVVRAAACRAIGVFMLFPALREDSTHAVDMASTVLDLCRDPNLAVRVRASWAVGNFCDAMVLLKTSGHDMVLQEILTLPLWTKIVRTALMICQDHEKLKSNGIRAIGGLLRVTYEGILERERHSLVKEAVYALIKHMEHGSLKGRWNACYAMQNVLLNADFPIGSTYGTSYAMDSDSVSWTHDVYEALLQAIQQSKNFKVRINACAALTVPKTRAKYGDPAMLRKIMQVLMSAVKNLDEEQGEHEFGEFQYRGQLETKLLRCLDHLLQLSGGAAKLDLDLDPALRQRILASRPIAASEQDPGSRN